MHIKCEDKQAGGTAKTRGATHKLFSLTDDQLRRGVVAASTGNHALALLLAAAAVQRQRGVRVPARIFLPRTASPGKLEALRERQAGLQQVEMHLELMGEDSGEAEAAARAAAEEMGATFVSSYNDVALAGGQGSIAVELLMQLPRGRLDTGGGLRPGLGQELGVAVVYCNKWGRVYCTTWLLVCALGQG